MNQDTLIAELSMQASKVRRHTPWRLVWQTMVVVIVNFAAITSYYGLRPDSAEQMARPVFIAEVGLNLLLIIVALCAAIWSAFPDRAHGRWMVRALWVVFGGYSLLVMASVWMLPIEPTSAEHTIPHGVECLVCMLIFSAFPALWMYWTVRKLASVRPALTGGASLLMAVALGALGVRLVEIETVSASLIYWHYLPLLLLSLAGALLGRKIFRW